jgi:LytS/YehU family sensor histidine kinase
VPRWILQPLVENAVRHGIAPHEQPGEIIVRAAHRGQALWVQVWNSTGPAAHQRSSAGTGVGLSNVRARLAQHYGVRANLALNFRGPGGYEATLQIPLDAPAESAAMTLPPTDT